MTKIFFALFFISFVHCAPNIFLQAANEVKSLIEQDDSFIPLLVRQQFHDCIPQYNNGKVRGCDACLNLADPDNRPLRRGASALEAIYYPKYTYHMSRADFWALASTTALVMGARNQDPGSFIPPFPIYTGRKSCRSDHVEHDYDTTGIPGEEFNFPDATRGFGATHGFFHDNFGFTPRDTTAILGAHTLGKARVRSSGFAFKWVDNNRRLDHEYYVDMEDKDLHIKWTWDGRRRQWTRDPKRFGNLTESNPNQAQMLNSDISLLRVITPDQRGVPVDVKGNIRFDCFEEINKHCKLQPLTSKTVQSYARDNKRWLTHFATVWIKMVNVKQSYLQKVVDDLHLLLPRQNNPPVHPPKIQPSTCLGCKVRCLSELSHLPIILQQPVCSLRCRHLCNPIQASSTIFLGGAFFAGISVYIIRRLFKKHNVDDDEEKFSYESILQSNDEI